MTTDGTKEAGIIRRALAARRWRRHAHRPSPGAAPGTIVVSPDAHPLGMRIVAYDADRVVEREISEPDQIEDARQGLPVTWIDVQGLGDASLVRRLGERYALHPLAIADIVHVTQRPKIETYDNHLFIILRQPHLVEGRVITEQIAMVVGAGFVVTFQERPDDCFDPVRERIRQGKGRIRTSGADYLAYALIDALVDSYFPVLEHFGEIVEALEEQVIADPDSVEASQIHAIKRELMELRRGAWPQRDVVAMLLRDDVPCIEPTTRVYLRDCADHAFQVMDLVEIYREVASGLVDLHLTSLSARMNDVMKVLTVIATIFIPLGFIASVYGMNFDRDASPFNMPELGWRFGYPLVLAIMGATALGLLAWFRFRRWIGGPSRTPRP